MAELSTLGSVIKTAYEGESNTNAFTDSDKSTIGSLKPVATSGKYSDLSGKPSIPAKVSDLSDGGDYAKTSQLFDGSYSSLSGKPDNPSDASDVSLTSDVSGESDVQAALAALESRIDALENA